MLDLAVFTIRFGKSVIGVGLAVGLLNCLSLEMHSAIILSYVRPLSRARHGGGRMRILEPKKSSLRRLLGGVESGIASAPRSVAISLPYRFAGFAHLPNNSQTPIFQVSAATVASLTTSRTVEPGLTRGHADAA